MCPEKQQRKNFYLVSLGCAKNTVDSDSMAAILAGSGYRAVEQARWADVLIVNTCGFIQPARDESIEVLQELAQKKRKDQVLIAAGCLPQRSREVLLESVKGIDGILSTRRWMDILELVDSLRKDKAAPRYDLPAQTTVGMDEQNILRAAIQGRSAYLKDRGWLPPTLRILLNPTHQGHRRQPTTGADHRRSQAASRCWYPGDYPDRTGHN